MKKFQLFDEDFTIKNFIYLILMGILDMIAVIIACIYL
jgi:hypothetical protein